MFQYVRVFTKTAYKNMTKAFYLHFSTEFSATLRPEIFIGGSCSAIFKSANDRQVTETETDAFRQNKITIKQI